MEHQVDLNSVKSVRSKYPLTILDDKVLNSNEKFIFLKSELINLYNNLNPVHCSQLHTCSTSKYKKQLYINLHLILTEVVLTTDTENRQDLLEKAHKWYHEKMGISKTQNPSSSNLIKNKIKIKPLIHTTSQTNKLEIPHNTSLANIPMKKKEKSREISLEKYVEKYNKMLENEKISFGIPLNRGFISRTPEKKKIKTKIIDKEDILKVFNKKNLTPELIQYDKFEEQALVKPIKDFRKVAHKFRTIKPSSVNREVSQFANSEVKEIRRIKSKLSKNKIKVDVKSLENAMCLHREVKLNSSSHKRFPTGGEFLLKAKFPTIRSKISHRTHH